MASKRSKRKKIVAELDHEFEIEQYIQALGSSSSRVRLVMLAIIIATIAAAATLWSERDGSWERARLTKIADNRIIAKICGIWNPQYVYATECRSNIKSKPSLFRPVPPPPEIPPYYRYLYSSDCLEACEVWDWFGRYGIASDIDAETFAERQWEAYTNNVLYVKMPVLGLSFDINDLGLMTGFTFFILMLVMAFYTHRAHENLAVCMWKVRELTERDQCFDQPGSKPNLLYHAIAMQQVFTIPPTLARWRDNWMFRHAHYALFFLPFFVQFWVGLHDFNTSAIGKSFSSSETNGSLISQGILLLAVLFLCILCCAHLHADDVLWRRVFTFINPVHRFKGKARWIHWTHIANSGAPGWGIIAKNKQLYLSDSVHGLVWKTEQEKIRPDKELRGRGLCWINGRPISYSLSPGDPGEFRGEIRWWRWWPQIYWSEENNAYRHQHVSVEVVKGLWIKDQDELLLWQKQLGHNFPPMPEFWSTGGALYQSDGSRAEAGFESIRALLPNGKYLFITDGAWLRRVDESGQVTTLGGKPLAGIARRESPLLLGMALPQAGTKGRISVEPRKNYEKDRGEFLPEIFVCDFSARRVFGVTSERVEEFYRSRLGWSPSGIWIDETNEIYLLEYRRGSVWGELATSIQTRRRPWFLYLPLMFRVYLRVRYFGTGSFRDKPKTILRISPYKAWMAKKTNGAKNRYYEKWVKPEQGPGKESGNHDTPVSHSAKTPETNAPEAPER